MAQKNKKRKLGVLAAAVISLLSFGAFAFAAGIVTKDPNAGLALVSRADDGEDESEDEKEDEHEDEDEDEDEDEEKEADKAEKERIKKLKEESKKKYEIERERLKKEDEIRREANKKKAELMGWGGNELEDEDESEDENEDESEDESEDLKDLNDKKADILEDIYDEILDAEEEIMGAKAEGIDVTKALATLALAKAKADEIKAGLDTLDIGALKRLEREVKKLAHFASHKDVKDMEHIVKDVQKISKRIAQTKGKISLLESLGGDSSQFKEALTEAETDFTAAKELIAKGGEDLLTGLSQLDPLERRVKSIKSSVEGAIYALGGTDEEYDSDYENEVEDLVEELKDIAEIEGDEVGEQLQGIADAQEGSAKTVGEAVEKIDNRSRVLQLLFGSRNADIEKLESEIAANKARIDVLNQAAGKIEDADVKQILLDQVASLETETQKLETFVSGQKDRLSLFGWLINLNPGQK